MQHPPKASASRAEYRPEIDGLRAIAVFAVLFYHLQVPWLAGGFVGVDVFFVISGFLITGIVNRAVERSDFDFAAFYLRRARRLLPALFVVITASFVAGFLIMTPDQLRDFGRSAIETIIPLSNIRFWLQAGYFDAASSSKPLLHGWSLSVEWQFYAIWPAFILLVMLPRRPWVAVAGILAAALLSLVANLAFQNGPPPPMSDWPLASLAADGRSTIFYLTPFRVFEFAAGAILNWIALERLPKIAREGMLLVGLALLAHGVFALDDKAVFPLNVLTPAVGAMFVIATGRGPLGQLLLGNPVASYLGRASYSIYLVHWPLIVFTELYFFEDQLSSQQVAWLFAVSLAVGVLLHHAVEEPFHRGRLVGWTVSRRGARIVLLGSGLAIIPLCWAAWDGLAWRINEDALGIRTTNTASLIDADLMGRIGCDASCAFGNPAAPAVLLVGDSHLDHYSKTLNAMAGGRYRFYMAYGASCFFGMTMTWQNPTSALNQQHCAEARAQLKQWLPASKYSAVVIGELWSGYQHGLVAATDGHPINFGSELDFYKSALADVAANFHGFAGKVVILGRAPNTNLACYLRPGYLPLPCPDAWPLEEFKVFRQAFDAFRATTDLDVSLVSPVDTICPSYAACRFVDDDGHILYTDAHHLSTYGARLIVPQILAAMGPPVPSKGPAL